MYGRGKIIKSQFVSFFRNKRYGFHFGVGSRGVIPVKKNFFSAVLYLVGSRGVIPVKKPVFFSITAAIIKILEFLKF